MALERKPPKYKLNAVKCALCGLVVKSGATHNFVLHGCNGPDAPQTDNEKEQMEAQVWFSVSGGKERLVRTWKPGLKEADCFVEISELA